MVREIIVTSPYGVRLAFTATGEKGLEVMVTESPHAMIRDIDEMRVVGLAPTSWVIELNEEVS